MGDNWEENNYDGYDLTIYVTAAFCLGVICGIILLAVVTS